MAEEKLTPQEIAKKAKQAKLRAMANAIKSIEKVTKKEGIAYKMGDKPHTAMERFSSGALPLDIALGGGIPKGRIIELFGAESSGKTLISSKCIAECQKNDGVCAFVDVEHSFDPTFASKLGVQVDELFMAQPDHMTEAFTVIDKFIDAGCDLIVLDSTAALVPKEEFEGEEVLKTTIGLIARGMSQFLRRITPKLATNNCSIIFINQVRDNIGVMYGDPTTTPGGKALKFYSSIRIRVSRDKTNDVTEGDDIIQRGIKCSIIKNKTAIPYKTCSFGVYLDGKEANKDITTDIANIACDMGLIGRFKNDGTPSKAGRNWKASCEGDELVVVGGREDVIEELKNHPVLKDYLLKVIKGEIEKPDNTLPKEEEMTEEEFEKSLEEDLSEAEWGSMNELEEAEEMEWGNIND